MFLIPIHFRANLLREGRQPLCQLLGECLLQVKPIRKDSLLMINYNLMTSLRRMRVIFQANSSHRCACLRATSQRLPAHRIIFPRVCLRSKLCRNQDLRYVLSMVQILSILLISAQTSKIIIRAEQLTIKVAQTI